MKIQSLILTLAGTSIMLSGCVNPDGTQNNTGSGALIGGAAGALTGAAIGGSRHGGQDALIGAAAGALAGGLIGYSMDQEQAVRLKQQAPETYARVDQGRPLSVTDVKLLVKSGINEDVIIGQINNSHTIFHLSASDIIDLHDAGVSDKVIDCMIHTPSLLATPSAAPTGTVIYATPAPPTPLFETVVVAPGPDLAWVGGEWVWNGGWFWVGGHWGHPPYPHAIWVGGRSWHDSSGWHAERGHWR